jgi:hypothetical protein
MGRRWKMKDLKALGLKVDKQKKPRRVDGYRSDLEAEYAKALNRQMDLKLIWSWRYEPFRVVCGAGAWYKPDFLIVTNTGHIVFHEVKNRRAKGARAGIAALKAAALIHPYVRFYLIEKDESQPYVFGFMAFRSTLIRGV